MVPFHAIARARFFFVAAGSSRQFYQKVAGVVCLIWYKIIEEFRHLPESPDGSRQKEVIFV